MSKEKDSRNQQSERARGELRVLIESRFLRRNEHHNRKKAPKIHKPKSTKGAGAGIKRTTEMRGESEGALTLRSSPTEEISLLALLLIQYDPTLFSI